MKETCGLGFVKRQQQNIGVEFTINEGPHLHLYIESFIYAPPPYPSHEKLFNHYSFSKLFFSFVGYRARNLLAVMDYMHHKDRPVKKDADGNDM